MPTYRKTKDAKMKKITYISISCTCLYFMLSTTEVLANVGQVLGGFFSNHAIGQAIAGSAKMLTNVATNNLVKKMMPPERIQNVSSQIYNSASTMKNLSTDLQGKLRESLTNPQLDATLRGKYTEVVNNINSSINACYDQLLQQSYNLYLNPSHFTIQYAQNLGQLAQQTVANISNISQQLSNTPHNISTSSLASYATNLNNEVSEFLVNGINQVTNNAINAMNGATVATSNTTMMPASINTMPTTIPNNSLQHTTIPTANLQYTAPQQAPVIAVQQPPVAAPTGRRR